MQCKKTFLKSTRRCTGCQSSSYSDQGNKLLFPYKLTIGCRRAGAPHQSVPSSVPKNPYTHIYAHRDMPRRPYPPLLLVFMANDILGTWEQMQSSS